ncbi:restriction endonuclease subunit S [uncultured Microbacterium sp.]|uniref:restriction endonuclease subunit S n=1 Tax=uncultured Microbacterium sp. TaxID=191216 RepID=UPI0026143B73|nr:restriction endonuclease subunit S [uncultured Microbacterium sp.]
MTWETVPLGAIAQVVGGATPKTSEPAYWDGDIPWVTPAEISRLSGHYIESTERSISSDGLSRSGVQILPTGSVLLSSRAPIGLVAINRIPVGTNQGFKSLIPSDRIESNFLFWWLKSHTKLLQSKGRGATFLELSKAEVERIEIPLPPLPEQRRIAAILDEADSLVQLRNRVVDAMRELRDGLYVATFGSPRVNPHDHALRQVDAIASTRLGKMLDAKQQTGQHPTLYLRNANIRWFEIDLNNLARMDITPTERLEYSLVSGDVLVCEGGEPGRAAIWSGELKDIAFQKALHRVRVDTGQITPEVFVHTLRALQASGQLSDSITSATISHLTGEKLRRLRIPVPPLEAQHDFGNLLSVLADSEARAASAWGEAQALAASLQHRAFRGEL